ncbi:von Willebrand factor [Bremerella volcania]|uniref:von Willebrand factor n=1 Tax=Bremerella volcania TaxID=2527984 RepID=A0A518C1U8_9BACT|nr:VWA domain-containing protein [Bremerella volcania]QDU73193.1 von Willebrand factor [Bremerella volcania]
MKKIWILTPLLLGVSLVGCNAQPGDVAATSQRAPGADNSTHTELSSADESLTQVPLEGYVEPGETNFSVVPEQAEVGQMQMGRQAQSNTAGPVPTEPTPTIEPGYYGGKAIRDMAEESKPVMDDLSSQLDGQPVSGEREEVGKYAEGTHRIKQLQQMERNVKEQPYRENAPASEAKRADVAKKEAAPEAPPAPVGASAMSGPAVGDPAARVASNPVPATKPAESDRLQGVEARTRFSREGEVRSLDFKPLDEMRLEFDKPGDGVGPGEGGDKFEPIEENDFIAVADQPLSTFSIDVDTASYSKIRSYLSQFGQLPPRDAVRVEELVNYFTYDYATPTDEHPFAANVEVASCPWNPSNRLVRVGIKGKEIDTEDRPASNLVFLLDVSGSMNNPNKLPLLKKGMKMLVDQLGENDKVSIVVYAGAAGMVLEPTYGYEKAKILEALDRLQAGGSTNGGQGIQLAYKTATENFIQGGTNRVILCTDGDFNVGETSTGGLVGMAAEQAKKNIYLSVMGFGIGNHNDSMLEQLSNKANGNYSFIDNEKEAKKVLVEQMSGTLLTIAKDVKIQIEFNPKKVASYRLVGYENRLLAAQDFNDDKKDAGEIGAGHTVTAFYEVVPAKGNGDTEVAAVDPKVDELKYQTKPKTTKAANSNELMTLKLRYKQPEEDVSTLMTYPVVDSGNKFNQATGDFQFASAVAMFGLKLRGSHFHHETNFAEIEELVASNVDGPGSSYREEFLEMIRQVERLQK